MDDKKRQENLDRYYWLKEHHICVRCGKKEAFRNRVCCEDCIYHNNEYYHSNRARLDKTKKERQARYRAEGRCVVCGKPRDGKSIILCNKCLEVSNKARRKYARRKRDENRLPYEEWKRIKVETIAKNRLNTKQSEKYKAFHEQQKRIINSYITLHKNEKAGV